MIEQLQNYFYEEKGEELGVIGATNLLTFFEENIAPYIYNVALHDAKHVLEQKWGALEEELYILEKKIPV